ncbi:hypothetical protein [Kitasatospora sp. NBC_00315]|uniref:hypothetical protein n=1 Tax=Kitasatospora sp. NBC_00315 TaxID=2975963 RepID=UPI00324915F1
MTGLSWVPTSCTLPTEQQPLRVAEWDALFAERLTAVDRPGPLRLHLVLAGGESVEERVRDLAARESGCCSFFTFTTVPAPGGNGGVLLAVEVDPAHGSALEALGVRAAAVAAGAGRSR